MKSAKSTYKILRVILFSQIKKHLKYKKQVYITINIKDLGLIN